MGRRLVILPLAQRDLDGILDYTARIWGSRQAERYHAIILKTFEFIAQRPDLGARRDAIPKSILSRRAGKHHIFYIVKGDEIRIIRILYERMDFKRKLH